MINFLLNNSPLLYWTQSLWRDEAFSVWMAQDSLAEVIKRTSGDFNPPLYYLLLRVWMQIFGRSEIALRGMSLFIFLLFLIVVYFFTQKIFKDKRHAYMTTLLMAVNPMLVYFAFELRMYSLLVVFSTLSMYFLYTKNTKWYVVTSSLGLYTQPFMALVIAAQGFYLLLKKQWAFLWKSTLAMFILYLPWLPTLVSQFRASGPMWIYPVDANLIFSVLGNLYFGYEGTPGTYWPHMKFISLILITSMWLFVKSKKFRTKALLFYSWVFIPLVIALGVSLVKPIYVHRYLIFVTVGEVLLISLVLNEIKEARLKKFITASVLILTFITNFIPVPSFHRKVDIRSTFKEVVPLLGPSDVVYAASPLVYFESVYYMKDIASVYLYNPESITPPLFVGGVGMPKSTWRNSFPEFPERVFFIQEDGNYRIVSRLNPRDLRI